MFRNSYQRGMLTVFFSVGSKPFNIWETHTQDGYITRFLDQDIKSMVVEIGGTNVSTTYMVCPKGNAVLGITMPFLVMIVKNLKKYFSFEVTILDETGTRRRFRVSNFQSTTQILPLCTVMPIGLSAGWNQIQFNLAEFTWRAYKKSYVEVQKIKINANIRLRRIYFTERLVPEDQLPPEYKLFFPLSSKVAKGRKALEADDKGKENIKVTPLVEIIEEYKLEEVNGHNTDVIKAASKPSILSEIKSLSKQDSNMRVVEDVTPLGSKKTSVISTSAANVDEPTEFEDQHSKNSVEEISSGSRKPSKASIPEGEAPLGSRQTSIFTTLEGDALPGSRRPSIIPGLIGNGPSGSRKPSIVSVQEGAPPASRRPSIISSSVTAMIAAEVYTEQPVETFHENPLADEDISKTGGASTPEIEPALAVEQDLE